MDRDGTKDGFDLPLTAAVTAAVNVPVIASGGVIEDPVCQADCPAPVLSSESWTQSLPAIAFCTADNAISWLTSSGTSSRRDRAARSRPVL